MLQKNFTSPLPSTEDQPATQAEGNRLAQGRLPEQQPVAVIDIGSNSVRQVVYEGMKRAPAPLFNEKVLCGLGKGLAKSNKLDDVAVDRALHAIRRFRQIGRQLNVDKTFILATAAAREAKNGAAFIEQVEAICGTKVDLLSGEEEALYSANGIRAGFYHVDGIVGDLGGGSLELVAVGEDQESAHGQTFPLGGLRLQELSDGDLGKAKKIAREHLSKCNIDWPGRYRNLYAVGGTWRSLAKLSIRATNHPIHVLHHYSQPADEFVDLCKRIVKNGLSKIDGSEAISKKRRQLLPFGAVAMIETIQKLEPERIVFSSLGIREGFLFSRLNEELRQRDPLLDASWDMAKLRSRCPQHAHELAEWTGHAFSVFGINETQDERRFRIAACYLADIAWRMHPDYRASQSHGSIANAGLVGISHHGHAYIAIANHLRHQGLNSLQDMPAIAALADERLTRRARLLAALFRVGYLYSASAPGVLPKIKFSREEKSVTMTLDSILADLPGERPATRLENLAKESGFDVIEKVLD